MIALLVYKYTHICSYLQLISMAIDTYKYKWRVEKNEVCLCVSVFFSSYSKQCDGMKRFLFHTQLTLPHKDLIDIEQYIATLDNHPFNGQILAQILRFRHFVMHLSKVWREKFIKKRIQISNRLNESVS